MNRTFTKISLQLISMLLFLQIGTAFGTTHTITVQNNFFNPSSLSALVGDTIKWQWMAGTHTTTSMIVPSGASSWAAPMTSSTPTFTYVLTVAGTYSYNCAIHSTTMLGTITAGGTGISQTAAISPVILYPNPFRSTLILDARNSPSFTGNVMVELYNLAGEKVYELPVCDGNSNLVHMELEALPAGDYMLMLNSDRSRSSYRVMKVD